VYNIPRGRICYIHGVADGEFAQLTVGNNKNNQEVEEMFAGDNDIEAEARQEIINLVNSWRKDTDTIIRNNQPFFDSLHDLSEIYVLGHSMAEVDMPYFQVIKGCINPNAVWTLSVYDENDKRRKDKAIMELGITPNNIHWINLDDLSVSLPERLNFDE